MAQIESQRGKWLELIMIFIYYLYYFYGYGINSKKILQAFHYYFLHLPYHFED